MLKQTKVILLSQRLYYDISKYVDTKDVYVCANGIPDENTEISTLNYITQNYESIKILFLSNISRSKGVDVLLDALCLLKTRGVSFECDIVGSEGDMSLVELVKKVKENNLVNVVNILGAKYGSEKFEVLAKADLLVHPTLDDCFPLVILEALMFGLPVISSREGAIEDIIFDSYNGFLVDKNKPAAIADALENLAANKKLIKEMSVNARTSYVQHFTVERFESSLEKILTL